MLFQHQKKKGAVYILFNEPNSRYRFRAAKFVLEKGFAPTYPALMRDFFELKEKTKKGIDERAILIKKCKEVWVFGDVSASMWNQITIAKNQGKKVRYFSVLSGQFMEREDPEEPVKTY